MTKEKNYDSELRLLAYNGNSVSLQDLKDANLSIAEVWKNANQTPIARK